MHSLLKKVQAGSCSVDEALGQLAHWPFADLDVARFDHHRQLRCGFAEVVFGSGKTAADLVKIIAHGVKTSPCMLATRVDEEQARLVKKRFPKAVHNPRGRTLLVGKPRKLDATGEVLVITAGTSDIPVAEEALETLHAFGCPAKKYYDVGVAGLHRILAVLPELQNAGCIICVAGMEGALPSVVGGLVSCPVIAVPTSVGYGASFKGLAAMLAMLNTCAAGVSVVNIDNGFGAAMCALRTVSRRNGGKASKKSQRSGEAS